MMDAFFASLPFQRKLRMHFHRFMQRVHAGLTAHSGAKNPLERVAAEIADEASVLCFDEFFVSDIGDAMILAGLIEALFARGVALVATSNIPPSDLYKDGLQRGRFLPAIALIEKHLKVVISIPKPTIGSERSIAPIYGTCPTTPTRQSVSTNISSL